MKNTALRIAVASGKGGTGKTTIATNLAVALSENGYHVKYADCDVEEPNGHLFLKLDSEDRTDVRVMIPEVPENDCSLCGVCAEVCEFNALAVLGTGVIRFPSLCHSCGACVVLCPERALTEGTRPIGFIRSGKTRGLSFVGGSLRVGEAQAPPMIRAIKKGLSRDDEIVIIDAPPGTSCPVVESVRETDYVLLVTEPTPFGLNDLRLAVGMLRELELPFGVVINRSDTGNSLVWDYCASEGIPILLELRFDRRIAEAYAAGNLAADFNPGFRRSIRGLFKSILRETANVRACHSER